MLFTPSVKNFIRDMKLLPLKSPDSDASNRKAQEVRMIEKRRQNKTSKIKRQAKKRTDWKPEIPECYTQPAIRNEQGDMEHEVNRRYSFYPNNVRL